MSASKNPDANINQEGEFRSRVPGSEPLMTGGHQPGRKVSPADHAPEFHAETLPAGTAPSSSTYTPNPDLNNQKLYQSASSTLTGADSKDVHTGLGHPGSGQTSQELHDGSKGRATAHVGQVAVKVVNDKVTGRDPYFAIQRNLEEDVPAGQRGNVGGPAANERIPEPAETVAAESKS
ncbi:hypothetical protein CC80DRAFT_422899 [Byssothecium circinans]|uniref:Uncharacterized protein n=1 Tax=Byssothecium circinans TaxID=147558 RepID=A0A6A5TIL4_9PLEO|nr:hypothetical protein CC80DRAFT_422899 [Byssothecium circinans]